MKAILTHSFGQSVPSHDGVVVDFLLDLGGISHHSGLMTISSAKRRRKPKAKLTVVREYDSAADAKNRISLRGAKAKHFRVKALSNGSYLLEPRVLVPTEAVPAKVLNTLDESVVNLKEGNVSPPIDLTALIDD